MFLSEMKPILPSMRALPLSAWTKANAQHFATCGPSSPRRCRIFWTTQVAANITDVDRGASETGSAFAQVLASAQSLSGGSRTLKSEVERFLSNVRAT
jgi:hypothetical protein